MTDAEIIAGLRERTGDWELFSQEAAKRIEQFCFQNETVFNEGVASVLTIRCNKHFGIPQQNKNEFSGGECGGCIAEEIEKLRDSHRELVEALKMWKAYFQKDIPTDRDTSEESAEQFSTAWFATSNAITNALAHAQAIQKGEL